MSLDIIQIENLKHFKKFPKPKAGYRKWLKKMRNRHIRRTDILKEPFTRYKGWEY